MKTNNIEKIAQIIMNIMTVLSVLVIIWIFTSWINIATNNGSAELVQNQWAWNFFKVVFKF